MTNKETANHIRKYFKTTHAHWSWCTDGCGYDQHINFVKYRNEYWFGGSFEEFKIFTLDYADKLEKIEGGV